MEENKEDKKKLYLFMAAAYEVFAFILCCHIGIYQKSHSSAEFGELVSGGIAHMKEHFLVIFPITGEAWKYFAIVTFVSVIAALMLYYNERSKEVTMRGKEGGSAEWNKDLKKYNRKYTDPYGSARSDLYPSNNIILSNDVFLNMNTKKTRQNNHVLVIGGSGSGKSRFYVKPNILQFKTSIFVTDPAADILAVMGKPLLEHGYELKVLNLTDMAKSHRFNPFRYLNKDKEEEVLQMVDCFISNTESGDRPSGDAFWTNAEKLLYTAISFYLLERVRPEDQNWSTVVHMISLASVDENNSEKESTLDKLFNALAKENPNSLAVKYYGMFKQGAGKTLKSILISASVRTAVFSIPAVKYITDGDDMELEKLATEKMAYFLVISQTSATFNFLSAMLYSTAFNVLYEMGKNLMAQHKRFKYDVRFLLDEHANSGTIPRFPEIVATARKYDIGISTILQNIGQLNSMYDKKATSVSGNSDTILYLGGSDLESAEFISKLLGKRTIRTSNTSHSHGGKSGYSESFQYTARDLMSPDEIIRLPKDTCIVIPAGQRPFLTKKFDYERHPNYCETGDADPANLYKLDVHKIHEEIAAKDRKEEIEKKKQTQTYIESEMKLSVKKSLGDVPVIKSLPDLMESYENLHGVDIFKEMGDIKTDVDITEKEKAIISNEVARVIMTSIKDSTARSIIASFKQKNIKKTESSSSASSVPLIIDEIMATSSEDIDDFAQMWL